MASSFWDKSCINVSLILHPITQIASIYLTFNVLIWLILPRCSKIHTIQFLEKRKAVKESILQSVRTLFSVISGHQVSHHFVLCMMDATPAHGPAFL